MDARQFSGWGKYLTSINWKVKRLAHSQIFIREIPFLASSAIKFQRPKNPIPFDKLEALAKEHHALSIIIEPILKDYNEQEFIKHGYQKSKILLGNTATMIIDLKKSEKEILASFSQSARRNIRKAQEFKLVVTRSFVTHYNTQANIQACYNLLKEVAKSKHFYLPSFLEMTKKMKSFASHSFILYAQESPNQPPIACLWIIYEADTAVYLHPGITKRGYEMFANYLLVWEALKTAKKLKLKQFDFESIYDPRYPNQRRDWLNFTEFKSRFHGEILFYPPTWIKFYNPFFKFSYLLSTFIERS